MGQFPGATDPDRHWTLQWGPAASTPARGQGEGKQAWLQGTWPSTVAEISFLSGSARCLQPLFSCGSLLSDPLLPNPHRISKLEK